MRRGLSIFLVFLPWAFLPLHAGEEPDAARIPDLVRQLGADDFHAREKASNDLEEMGPEILPALREHRQHNDPEVRARIEALIATIMAQGRALPWMSPDKEGTPECRSGIGGASVELTFKNASRKPVRIFWLQWDGTRRPWRGILEAGQSAVCDRSYDGHLWLITDKDGKGLGIYQIDRDDPMIVVRDELWKE